MFEMNLKPPTDRTFDALMSSIIAGSASGIVVKTIMAPIDRIRITYQVNEVREFKYKLAAKTVRRFIREEGLRGLFRGNSASVIRVFPYFATQFMAHEQLKSALNVRTYDQKVANPYLSMTAGALAGGLAIICTYPLDVARARLATDMGYNSLYCVFKKAVISKNARYGLYRGFSAACLAMVPYSCVCFHYYELAKMRYLPETECRDCRASRKDKKEVFVNNVILGTAIAFIGQTLIYPLDTVRRRMQVDKIHEELTFREAWKHVYRQFGWRGYYKAITLSWIKMPFAAGIGLAMFDYFYNGTQFLRTNTQRMRKVHANDGDCDDVSGCECRVNLQRSRQMHDRMIHDMKNAAENTHKKVGDFIDVLDEKLPRVPTITIPTIPESKEVIDKVFTKISDHVEEKVAKLPPLPTIPTLDETLEAGDRLFVDVIEYVEDKIEKMPPIPTTIDETKVVVEKVYDKVAEKIDKVSEKIDKGTENIPTIAESTLIVGKVLKDVTEYVEETIDKVPPIPKNLDETKEVIGKVVDKVTDTIDKGIENIPTFEESTEAMDKLFKDVTEYIDEQIEKIPPMPKNLDEAKASIGKAYEKVTDTIDKQIENIPTVVETAEAGIEKVYKKVTGQIEETIEQLPEVPRIEEPVQVSEPVPVTAEAAEILCTTEQIEIVETETEREIDEIKIVMGEFNRKIQAERNLKWAAEEATEALERAAWEAKQKLEMAANALAIERSRDGIQLKDVLTGRTFATDEEAGYHAAYDEHFANY